ncbi:MAG: sce7726 family protein [Acidobacteriota bacterium]|nr:sce7726 family protein [Acidobacteriota bacterium]
MLKSTPARTLGVDGKVSEMCDRDIRLALRKRLDLAHQCEQSTLVIEELGLCEGAARVDIAVINGSIEGYEIKSERDTLYRLRGQVEIYNKTLNKVTIVAGTQHIKRVAELVPDWWGVEEVSFENGDVAFHPRRKPSLNPCVDPHSVVQLLWREEAIEVLKDLGLSKGVLTKPRAAIWSKLADSLSVEELCSVIRECMLSRGDWRSSADAVRELL